MLLLSWPKSTVHVTITLRPSTTRVSCLSTTTRTLLIQSQLLLTTVIGTLSVRRLPSTASVTPPSPLRCPQSPLASSVTPPTVLSHPVTTSPLRRARKAENQRIGQSPNYDLHHKSDGSVVKMSTKNNRNVFKHGER